MTIRLVFLFVCLVFRSGLADGVPVKIENAWLQADSTGGGKYGGVHENQKSQFINADPNRRILIDRDNDRTNDHHQAGTKQPRGDGYGNR